MSCECLKSPIFGVKGGVDAAEFCGQEGALKRRISALHYCTVQSSSREGKFSRCGISNYSSTDVVGTNLAVWVGWSCGIGEVPQMTPLLFSPQNSSTLLTLPPIIYSVLTCENEKMSQSFSNNTNSLNTSYTAISVSNNFTAADDRSNILAWLSPLDPKLRHQDIRDRRIENIGEWLLQTEEFRAWNAGSEGSESDKAVLFCYGDPGVGKTYIR